jgi:hypothetical protein
MVLVYFLSRRRLFDRNRRAKAPGKACNLLTIVPDLDRFMKVNLAIAVFECESVVPGPVQSLTDKI